MRKLLQRLSAPVHEVPFTQALPLDLRPVKDKSAASILWRRLRPWLSLLVSRQLPLQRDAIVHAPKRLLWIYKGSPQIGDALMDLSSRVLLKNAGFQVDLYTDPHLAKLFAADQIFSAVFSEPSQIDPNLYDLAILDSFKARCLKVKIQQLRRTPFVTMRAYFSGPEFNRTLFSFFRMLQLLGQQKTVREVSCNALPYLFSSSTDRDAIAHLPIQPGAVAFAIGGADAARTYQHWDAVISEILHSNPAAQIVLLGSENGQAMAARIMTASAPAAARIINCIAAHSLLETFEILKKCRLAVCCDGGLLHLAHAAKLPTIALFDCNVYPAMRLTAANNCMPLCSAGRISELPASEIASAIHFAMAR